MRVMEENMAKYILLFYIAMSLIAFILYGVDKARAIRNRRRIPEKVLLGVGFFGGAAGALLGMSWYRHKTRHWYFWVLLWLFFIAQVFLLVALYQQSLAIY